MLLKWMLIFCYGGDWVQLAEGVDQWWPEDYCFLACFAV
jgi:hypothetical protein